MTRKLTWIELNQEAIRHNVRLFRERIGEGRRLLIPVKANAYGHGLTEIAPLFLEAGADWLGVHSLEEAVLLQESGIEAPILILGYVPFEALEEVVDRGLHLTVASWETADTLARTAARLEKKAKVHVKVETGTHRQGVAGRELQILARFVHDSPYLELEGLSTHFANIEDTTDHSYARQQLSRFHQEVEELIQVGIRPRLLHTASSAATLLFDSTHLDMVRPGISAYGMWPSRETYVSLLQEGVPSLPLQPVLSWKTIVAQIKEVPSGSYVGYGCTYRSTRDMRLAVLPIGYYDGFDRGLSNIGYVLIRGQRAQIRGRVCMNLIMVDITDIPTVCQEDEVVLIGRQGEEEVGADLLGSLVGSINYEVLARINPLIPRVVVEGEPFSNIPLK